MQLFPEEGQQEQTAEEGTAGRRGSRAEEKNGSGWGGVHGISWPWEDSVPTLHWSQQWFLCL